MGVFLLKIKNGTHDRLRHIKITEKRDIEIIILEAVDQWIARYDKKK